MATRRRLQRQSRAAARIGIRNPLQIQVIANLLLPKGMDGFTTFRNA
jgi:hypothetical protein